MPTIPLKGEFELVSLNVSGKRGMRKRPTSRARFAVGRGVGGDAHAGVLEDRQVSLLAIEEIEEASAACEIGPERRCLLEGSRDMQALHRDGIEDECILALGILRLSRARRRP